jgi:hypothetical protein
VHQRRADECSDKPKSAIPAVGPSRTPRRSLLPIERSDTTKIAATVIYFTGCAAPPLPPDAEDNRRGCFPPCGTVVGFRELVDSKPLMISPGGEFTTRYKRFRPSEPDRCVHHQTGKLVVLDDFACDAPLNLSGGPSTQASFAGSRSIYVEGK